MWTWGRGELLTALCIPITHEAFGSQVCVCLPLSSHNSSRAAQIWGRTHPVSSAETLPMLSRASVSPPVLGRQFASCGGCGVKEKVRRARPPWCWAVTGTSAL